MKRERPRPGAFGYRNECSGGEIPRIPWNQPEVEAPVRVSGRESAVDSGSTAEIRSREGQETRFFAGESRIAPRFGKGFRCESGI